MFDLYIIQSWEGNNAQFGPDVFDLSVNPHITFIRSTGRLGRAGNAWLSAVTRRYKLVYSSNEEPWLIDLKDDPNELTNLYGQAKHRQQIRWMTERLSAYGKAHNDEYVELPRVRSWMQQVLKAD